MGRKFNGRRPWSLISRTAFRSYCLFLRAFLPVFLLVSSSCKKTDPEYQGYVEADYLYVSSPFAGKLLERPVRRGDAVSSGDLLFRLEPSPEDLFLKEQLKRTEGAQDRLADLKKGSRPSEIDATQASLEQAQAGLVLAKSELARVKTLSEKRVVSPEDLDRAQAEFDRQTAVVEQLKAQLVTAKLGAREDQIAAAEAELLAQQASADRAGWSAGEKRQFASEGGSVFDTYYEPGEYVASGRPVLSILRPSSIRLLFFVDEAEAKGLAVGREVSVENFAGEISRAKIGYISPQVEFNPPIIFSRDRADKLVYRIEARSDHPENFRVGQPITVRTDS